MSEANELLRALERRGGAGIHKAIAAGLEEDGRAGARFAPFVVVVQGV